MILNNSSINEDDCWGVSTPAERPDQILVAFQGRYGQGYRMRLSPDDARNMAVVLLSYAQDIEETENINWENFFTNEADSNI